MLDTAKLPQSGYAGLANPFANVVANVSRFVLTNINLKKDAESQYQTSSPGEKHYETLSGLFPFLIAKFLEVSKLANQGSIRFTKCGSNSRSIYLSCESF